VRGEDAGFADSFLGSFEGLPLKHELANAFKRQEGGMPFVHVENRRFVAQALQSAQSANPQQHLL